MWIWQMTSDAYIYSMIHTIFTKGCVTIQTGYKLIFASIVSIEVMGLDGIKCDKTKKINQ